MDEGKPTGALEAEPLDGTAGGLGSQTAGHDAMIGGTIGAAAGAVVGVLAGGPVGAVIGAIVGAGTSAAAVDIIDTHDRAAPGPAPPPEVEKPEETADPSE